MLTKPIRRNICLRLGPHIKYTCTGLHYYDKSKQKFVLCEGPYYWTWATHYYWEYVFEIFFFIYLWGIFHDVFLPEFTDTGENSKERDIKLLILVSGMLFWVLLTGIIGAFSIAKEFRDDICETQNQVFKLDEIIFKKFVVDRNRPVPEYPEKKRVEWLVKFDCYFPQIIPFLFGFALFIPGEPMHSFMEWALEIKFGWNWMTLPPWLLVVMACNVMITVIIAMVVVVTTAAFGWLFWFREACPDIQTMKRNWDDGLLYFKTAQLGKLSENDLIWMYRVFQLESRLLDNILSHSRMAYHSFAQQITLVISIFSLIRFQDVIFTGNFLGLTLAGILVLAGSLSMIMMVIESFGLEEIQNRTENFRGLILDGTKRSLAINKVTRSFTDVTIHLAGPYYRVNKSSYLEWCDEAINRLVSLLCSI